MMGVTMAERGARLAEHELRAGIGCNGHEAGRNERAQREQSDQRDRNALPGTASKQGFPAIHGSQFARCRRARTSGIHHLNTLFLKGLRWGNPV
jgi:hypothetical protein